MHTGKHTWSQGLTSYQYASRFMIVIQRLVFEMWQNYLVLYKMIVQWFEWRPLAYTVGRWRHQCSETADVRFRYGSYGFHKAAVTRDRALATPPVGGPWIWMPAMARMRYWAGTRYMGIARWTIGRHWRQVMATSLCWHTKVTTPAGIISLSWQQSIWAADRGVSYFFY